MGALPRGAPAAAARPGATVAAAIADRHRRQAAGEAARPPLPERAGTPSDEFRIPQKLYGRDAESAALREAFERAAESGVPELVVASGYAGIGKSSVVRALLRTVVKRRGRLIVGKFEQYKRDIPYFTISQALRELALDILAESEPGIARWRLQLAQALGPHGKLVVDLVPQLGLIVGPQPPVHELSLAESERRLRLVFGRLFAACATPEHPLAMFIDDMQWADTASLTLIASLLAEADTRHLLIVGAYRDNEVDPSHPMMRARRRHRPRIARRGDAAREPGPRQDRRKPVLRDPVPDRAPPEAIDLVRSRRTSLAVGRRADPHRGLHRQHRRADARPAVRAARRDPGRAPAGGVHRRHDRRRHAGGRVRARRRTGAAPRPRAAPAGRDRPARGPHLPVSP
ncbi:MAG: hypothetical protein E6J91_41105 [Deltaproteobacteria bacterium]|nr:MAG: hypothetical protein E6J91_41105 [Deltaproteobacteria bacterium]